MTMPDWWDKNVSLGSLASILRRRLDQLEDTQQTLEEEQP